MSNEQFFMVHGVWPTTTTNAFDVRVGYSKAGDVEWLKRYGSYAPENGGFFDVSTMRTPTLADDFQYDYPAGTDPAQRLTHRLQSVTDAVGPTPSKPWDAESATYSHDEKGRVSSVSGPRGFTITAFDHNDLPLSLTADGNTTEYRYDGSGQRIFAETYGSAGALLEERTYTLRDGGMKLGVVTEDATMGSRLLRWDILGGGQAIGEYNATAQRGRYYHRDHLGSVRVAERYSPSKASCAALRLGSRRRAAL